VTSEGRIGMEGVTRGNENGKGADLYQVKIHFDDG